ncbi:unnamed protein product [Schistosoma curassoni]|uniref:Protein lifeguard 3 n=1 Tax=Schistosoma curassoni TaxID=6186 RepID=A0A183KBU7_9TREM|nr:unnamed protein product [Schistosoma curassoni]
MADPRFQTPYNEPPYSYGLPPPHLNAPQGPYPTQPPHSYPPNIGPQWQGGDGYPYGNYNENPHSNSNNIGGEGGRMENQFTASSFSDKKIRHAFIRKASYSLSMMKTFNKSFVNSVPMYILLLVCNYYSHLESYVFFVLCNKPVTIWVRRNPWFYYLAYAIFFVTYLVLGCIVSVRRRFPGNYICLTVFTLALSYMAGSIGAFYGAEAALISVALTFALCICITLFAMQTRFDFTMCSGFLFVFSCVVMLTGIAIMIVYFVLGPNKILQGVYSGILTLLFGLFILYIFIRHSKIYLTLYPVYYYYYSSQYLAYDTQLIMGGREFELEPEEYIFGAMQLYVDVVFMFMAIAGIARAAS